MNYLDNSFYMFHKISPLKYIITKNDEKGTEKEVTDENGKKTTTTVKEFPIMGYKNSKSKGVVW